MRFTVRRASLVLGLAPSASLAAPALATPALAAPALAATSPCTSQTSGGEWPSYGHDANGAPLVRRQLTVDAGAAVTNITSAGVAIAEHEVFAAAGGLSYESAPGYVIAYRAG